MAFDHFLTNPEWIERAYRWLEGIDYDAASNSIGQHYVRAKTYAVAPDCNIVANAGEPEGTRIVDSLTHDWSYRTVWCNPPYSAGNIDKFVDKIVTSWYNSSIERMLVLVPANTDTAWFHTLLAHSSYTLLIRGRIKFWKIQDGEAWEVWEGIKSKERRALNPETKAIIGNSPRDKNVLFAFDRSHSSDTFRSIFQEHGTIIEKVS